MLPLVIAATLGFSAQLVNAQASAIVVTSCHTIIPAGAIGVLQADLACDGFWGVVLHHGATLDLNGHRISGSAGTVIVNATTLERRVPFGRWKIVGPGEIASARRNAAIPNSYTGYCVSMRGRGLLTISDVTIRDCQDAAVVGDRLRAERVTVQKAPADGIAVDWLRGTDLVVEDHGRTGIEARRIDARRLAVRRNATGVVAGSIRGEEVEATDNAGDGLAVSGNTNLRELVATGNAGYGVRAGSFLRLDRATVTGNDGAPGGGDVASPRKPVLVRTACGHSVKSSDASQSFGVCANDP